METAEGPGRLSPSPLQARDRSGLLIVTALAAIVGLFGYLFWGGYGSSHREALSTANNLATVLATTIEAALDRAQSDLRVFVPQITAADLAGQASPARRADIEARMGNHLRSFAAVHNYRVFDALGQTVFGAGSLNPHASFNVADRAWFKQLHDDPGRDLVMSEVVIGKGTLDQTVIVAVPIRDGERHLRGAVNASINLAYLQSLIDGLDIGPDGLVAVRRTDDLRLILRRPIQVDLLNTAVAKGGLTGVLRSGRSAGEGEFSSGVDNVMRTYAFRVLHGYPVAVVVAVAADDYLAPWRKQAVLGGTAAVALILALVVLHRRQERVRTQLRAMNRRLQLVLEAAAEGIVEIDAGHRVVLANPVAAEILGWPSVEAMVGKESHEALGHLLADGRPCVEGICSIRQTLQDGRTRRVFDECFRDAANGTPVPVEYAVSTQMVDGVSDGAVVVFHDIRDRKQAEERLNRVVEDLRRSEAALRAAGARLRMVLETAAEGIVGIDDESRIIFANPAAAHILGWPSPEAMLGEPSPEILGHRLADGRACREGCCPIHATLRDGETRRIADESFKGRNGTVLPVEYVVAALEVAGVVIGAIVAFHDITERRGLEEELQRSNAELEQFAYVASHDLRQPLRMVSSYLGLIERKLGAALDEDTRTFMDFAVGGAKRMDRLILDLLEYSRIGKTRQPVPVPLAEAAAVALNNLTVAVDEANADIVVAEGLPTVSGNPMELTRLFQNLIGNALKYRAPERRARIEIGCRHGGHEWLVSIKDNGIGIAPADRERAFGIFQRLVPQEEYEGTGIGLAVCRKIVEHHGGRIWIEAAEGGGSTFLFTLGDGSIAAVT